MFNHILHLQYMHLLSMQSPNELANFLFETLLCAFAQRDKFVNVAVSKFLETDFMIFFEWFEILV